MKKLFLIAAFLLAIFSTPAFATNLLMIHSDTCPICLRFMSEVGRSYDAQATGLNIPLKIFDIDEGNHQELLQYAIRSGKIKNVRGFPTFILLGDDSKEIDRVTGYANKELFYRKLNEIVKKHAAELSD